MIRIEFDKSDIAKIIGTLDNMLRVLPNIRDELTYKQSVDFRNLVFKNIESKKFESTWVGKKTTGNYDKWKTETMGLGNTPWKLYGDVIQNIDIIRNKGARRGHAVGVFTNRAVGGKSMWNKKGSRRYGRKQSISLYAYWLEHGNPNNNQKPRPIFSKTLDEFKLSGATRYHKYMMNKLRSKWR